MCYCPKPKAEGNITFGWSKHRGENFPDYSLHKHEISVLLPNNVTNVYNFVHIV